MHGYIVHAHRVLLLVIRRILIWITASQSYRHDTPVNELSKLYVGLIEVLKFSKNKKCSNFRILLIV